MFQDQAETFDEVVIHQDNVIAVIGETEAEVVMERKG